MPRNANFSKKPLIKLIWYYGTKETEVISLQQNICTPDEVRVCKFCTDRTVSYCRAGSPCPAVVDELRDSGAQRPRSTMYNEGLVQKFYTP